MTKRLIKWFTIGPAPIQRINNVDYYLAVYNGKDIDGNKDAIGEGHIGQSYLVSLIADKPLGLYAPNPPFSTPEGF